LIDELSIAYDRSVSDRLAASLYVGAVGAPAIGPVSYRHRASSALDPMAPLGHHLQDVTHVSDGVVTAGIYSQTLKVEASAFNAREPDNYRFNIDYQGARLDSYSGRVSVARPHVVLSGWAGYLESHDRLDPGTGMQRYGIALITGFGQQSTSLAYSYNVHHHGSRHHDHGDGPARTYDVMTSLLWETTLPITQRWSMYFRYEEVDKNADELGFLGGDLTQLFTIRPGTVGLSYTLPSVRRMELTIGGQATATLLPHDLELTYGTRVPLGLVTYLNLRPAG